MLRKTGWFLVVFALGLLVGIATQKPDRFNAAYAQEVDGEDELDKLEQRHFPLFPNDTALLRAQFYSAEAHARLNQLPSQNGQLPVHDLTYRRWFKRWKLWLERAEAEMKKEGQPPGARPAT